MAKNNKGRDRWHGATLRTCGTRNLTGTRSIIKAVVVRLAIWGVLPAELATWLIQHGA